MGVGPVVSLRREIEKSLQSVLDPHMGVNLADMGMLRRIDVSEDGAVEVGLVFPCIGCPAFEVIKADVCRSAAAVDGVNGVRVKIDWHEDWDKSDMAESARERALAHGYVI